VFDRLGVGSGLGLSALRTTSNRISSLTPSVNSAMKTWVSIAKVAIYACLRVITVLPWVTV
jgi:hypothetical protein